VRRVHISPYLSFPFSPLLIPDGRISRVRLAAAAFHDAPSVPAAGLSARSHTPAFSRVISIASFRGPAFIRVIRLYVRLRRRAKPLPTESTFAQSRCYRFCPALKAQVGGRYPTFFAHTCSCVRPPFSCRLRSSLFLQVFTGCRKSLLNDGLSRRYLCNPCQVAWIPTPPRYRGAFVRFFPRHFGLAI